MPISNILSGLLAYFYGSWPASMLITQFFLEVLGISLSDKALKML